jgi:glycerophosphoryl diester phosphodiesterase
MKKLILILLFFGINASSYAQKMKWNNNMVIAHRGAFLKNNYPQNSIAALKEAIRLKCYGSEFDVHMTKDSVLVVNHDNDLKGLPIASSTYQQLSEIKLANGESIPKVEEYIKVGKKQKKTKLILEIKPAADKQSTEVLAEEVFKLVKKMKAEAWVEYISFSYDALLKILELDPKAHTAILAASKNLPVTELKKDGIAQLDYHFSVYKTQNWIKEAHQAGLSINAWGVNDEENFKWLIENKVDFITTDQPELLFEILKK